MRSRKPIGIAVAIILGILLVTWIITRNETDTGSGSGAAVGKFDSVDGSSKSASDLTQPTDKPDHGDGRSPSPSTKESSAFNHARSCARFYRLAEFFDQMSKDPSSPLKNDAAAASLTEDQRAALMSNLQYVEEHQGSCGEIPLEDRALGYQLYNLAYEAARAGDMQAAACFTLGGWSIKAKNDAELRNFAKFYATNTRNFIADGVRRGNWKVVNAAVAAARTQHGIQEHIGFSNEERYYWYRLSQLGSPTPDWENTMGYEAANVAISMDATAMARAESMAMASFVDQFGKQKMKEEDLTSCDM